MYFKPKIFISSNLGILKLREDIKNFFDSVGAETILYEKDLTPSINPSTYRLDILESDFIIFILNEHYGNKTDTGKSGTHEEWEIALQAKIPKHVYVKKPNDVLQDEEMRAFLTNEIKDKYISYYYYLSEEDLLKQIQKTTFTIAREISLDKIQYKHIPEDVIKKLAVDFDYNKSLYIIKPIEEAKKNLALGRVDFIDTTILLSILDYWIEFSKISQQFFLDNKLNDVLNEMLNEYNKFSSFQRKHFTTVSSSTIYFDSMSSELGYRILEPGERVDYSQINDLLTAFIDKYEKFVTYSLTKRNDFDIGR